MLRAKTLIWIGCIAAITVRDPAAQPASDPVRIAQAQNITVGLIAGHAGSTDTRIAADIAAVVDDADRLRVLPMLGQGPVQNIADLIYLRGVDVAIVHADSLSQTMQRDAIPREGEIQYIAKLFQEEHILARRDIASLNDLNGKPVETGVAGTGTELTALNLLDALRVKPAVVQDGLTAALQRLRKGEVAALFLTGGRPIPILQEIEPGSGLHFLPIPLNAKLLDTYLPTSLDRQNYPNLIPVGPPIDTLAVGAVLVTLTAPADTPRAKRVNRFVDTLFERFERFRAPGFHPKWQEVNLSAQIQGWTRYPEAVNLLRRQDQAYEGSLRTAFEAYLSQSGQKTSDITGDRREALFRDFLHWRDQRGGP